MRARIQKWGNSLAMRIPKTMTSELGLRDGSEVELTLTGDGLRIRLAPPGPYTLSELLDKVTPENLPGEWDAGGQTGGESW
jgi:antitoxin MazE